MSPSLSPGLAEGPMAYDIESDRTIFFAGNHILSTTLDDFPGTPLEFEPDGKTWAYDIDANTWTDLRPGSGPSGLLGARMVYDSQSDRMIFSLVASTFLSHSDSKEHNETWTYDFNTNHWTNTHPDLSPPARNYGAMAYDAGSDQVVLWGGSSDHSFPNEIWLYDLEANTWTAQPVENSAEPPIRGHGLCPSWADVVPLRGSLLLGYPATSQALGIFPIVRHLGRSRCRPKSQPPRLAHPIVRLERGSAHPDRRRARSRAQYQ